MINISSASFGLKNQCLESRVQPRLLSKRFTPYIWIPGITPKSLQPLAESEANLQRRPSLGKIKPLTVTGIDIGMALRLGMELSW